MRYAVLIGAAALLVGAPAAAGAGGFTAERGLGSQRDWGSSPTHYVPGDLVVGFRADADRAAIRRANGRVGARVSERFSAFRMQLVRLPHGLAVAEAARAYRRDPAVAFAEPNYVRYPTALPADDLFADLWALDNTAQSHSVSDSDGDGSVAPEAGSLDSDVDAPEAWALQDGTDVVVAVLDSGVDVAHPDFSGQLWTNPGDPSGGGDDDLNGKIDDVNGWDFAENDATLLAPSSADGFDHGTHTAGTVAAALDDTTGVVGVCPGCKIMALKIARDSDGAFLLSAEIAALAYAKSKGAKIANLSFGGPFWTMAEREAIRQSGLLAVVSAGNDSLDNDMATGSDLDGDDVGDIFSPSYPAAFTLPNILTVGATNHADEHGYFTECHTVLGSKAACAFTNWGHDSVDVSAPGVDITSSIPGAAWQTWDGTSMAAPHVSGIAGLVLAQHPTFTVAQLKNAVMNSVEKPTLLKTMYIAPAPGLTAARTKTGSFTRTSGRVNALNALTAPTTNATPLTDGNVDGARTMSADQVGGSVSWPADINDVLKRKLRRGLTYRVTLVVPRGKDYDLYVWKPGSKEIWQPRKLRRASARAGSVDEVVQFKATATGVHYIHVNAWLYKSGKYTLKFRRVA